MIVFDKVRWQNFMSYGNYWTEVALAKNKNTLIVGVNGSGKSSFLDAITYGLFGKPFRNINRPQLMNTITARDMLVEITFSVGKHKYLIKRGAKPNIFDIYEDDKLIKQDSLVKDYQAYLENNILKIDYKSFCQKDILGSSNYVPFMQLPAQARRLIIEDLLDLQVFSSMNTILKEKIQENKDDLKETDTLLKVATSNLVLHSSHINSLQNDALSNIKRLKNSIAEETQVVTKNNATLAALKIEQAETVEALKKINYQKKFDQLATFVEKVNIKKRQITTEIEFYKNSFACPTCKQSIDETFKQHTITKFENSLKEIDADEKMLNNKQEALIKLRTQHDSLNNRRREINETVNKLNIENSAKSALKKSYEASIADLETSNNQVDNSKKEEFEKQIIELNETKTKIVNDKEIFLIAGQLLKDGGIKTLVIKQYIPIMNKIINQYLSVMNMFVEFTLDENFNETIKSRFRDEFSYQSFSEGEKARINLAILFAWREIVKLRNTADTNLLIFDEIFDGSLDIEGSEEFMKIINSLTAGTNVFVISHKSDAYLDKFEHVLKFEKSKNFSKMSIV